VKPASVLFVCMGNICRSPTAEGVFRHMVEQAGLVGMVRIDSAGTHDYHVGEPPDRRSAAYAATRGVDISSQRARHVAVDDFEAFDYIVAMDHDNMARLKAICPPGLRHKLHLFMSFAEDCDSDVVPDPYYGSADGFKRVYDYVECASRGLLDTLRAR
jgi:protein-tyrosine phosphatase